MLKKLLMWLFGKRLKKRSNPKKRHNARELVKEKTKSGATEKDQKLKTKKRRNKTMADEQEVKKETENKVEDKQEEATKPVAEDKAKTEDKKEVKEETKETKTVDKVEQSDQVENTSNAEKGILVQDILDTMNSFDERLSAMNAKLEAYAKENKDLKDEIAKKDDELAGMKNKYEVGNFGGMQKQGLIDEDKNANTRYESAKEYLERTLGTKLPDNF